MTIPDQAPSEGQFWLAAYLTAFLNSLVVQGYCKGTMELYRCISQRLCDVAQANNIGPGELDVDTMDNLADACLTTDTLSMKKQVNKVVRRFTEYLIEAGVMVRKEPLPSPGTVEHLCMELDHWLRTQRGQSGVHLRVYPNILTQFARNNVVNPDWFNLKNNSTHNYLSPLNVPQHQIGLAIRMGGHDCDRNAWEGLLL